MPRAIVHIGYHKTASTWFQESVYPRVTSHAYVPRERVKRAFLSASALQFDADWTREALELEPGRPPILCEEELSGYLHTGGLMSFLSKEMAARIRAVLPDARVLIFVRAQPEMIAACYQQYLRGGGTHSPRRYLWPADSLRGAAAAPYKIPRFSFDHFDYDRLVSHYVMLFGAANVGVYAFEPLQHDAHGFLERFAKDEELALDLPGVSLAKRNASYSPAIARLARGLNRFTSRAVGDKRHWLHVPYWYALRKKAIERLQATGALGARATPEQLLGEQAAAWIRQRYCESNRRLAALVPWDPAAYGYPLDAPVQPVDRPRRPAWLRWTTK
jgi:hypothetical protein